MNDIYPPELKRYGEIHGHICFGLAMGYRAGKCAQEEFGTYPAEVQEEVTVLMKNNDCVQEGIQLITPCTCQTWDLLQGRAGKYVFIFYHRALHKAVRIAPRPKIMAAYQPIAALKDKFRNKTVTKAERKHFWEINKQEVKRILEMPKAELFYLQRFELALLVKLNPYEAIYVPKPDKVSSDCLETPFTEDLS